MRIIDHFLAEHRDRPLDDGEIARMRDVAQILAGWNVGARVDEWRADLEARLASMPRSV
jgi:hypothetical protein